MELELVVVDVVVEEEVAGGWVSEEVTADELRE